MQYLKHVIDAITYEVLKSVALDRVMNILDAQMTGPIGDLPSCRRFALGATTQRTSFLYFIPCSLK